MRFALSAVSFAISLWLFLIIFAFDMPVGQAIILMIVCYGISILGQIHDGKIDELIDRNIYSPYMICNIARNIGALILALMVLTTMADYHDIISNFANNVGAR